MEGTVMEENNNPEEKNEVQIKVENSSKNDSSLSCQNESKEEINSYHCKYCGNVIDENSKFCTYCGKRNVKLEKKKENIKYLIAICSITGISLILSFVSIILNTRVYVYNYYTSFRIFTIIAFTFSIIQFIAISVLGILDYLKCSKKDKNRSLLFIISILSISLAMTIKLSFFLR